MLNFTGERYLPWAEGVYEGAYEHLHRYGFAAPLVRGKKVLDLASGEGYGSAILAREAAQVTGLDVDPQTVHHAASRYTQPNLNFIVGSITHVPLDQPHQFDVITCFEAFEHITRQDLLLTEAKRLLKPGGLFIISTPNRLVATDQTGIINPFHLKELYRDEFEQLMTQAFTHTALLGQRVLSSSHIWKLRAPVDPRSQDLFVKRSSDEFLWTDSTKRVAKFFVAVCSDSPLPNLPDTSRLTDVDDIRYADERSQNMKWSVRVQQLEKERDEFKNGFKVRDQELQQVREQVASEHVELAELRKLPPVLDEYRATLARIRGSRAYGFYRALKKIKRQLTG